MVRRLAGKLGNSFVMVSLVAILVTGGLLAACSRAPSTTSVTTTTATTTATSTSTRTTTSTPATTTTPAPATTTAPGPTAPAGPSAADFYRDNVARIIVPYGPGGTTDLYARLIASLWPEVTGGRMVVVNKEGGGGLLGANYAYTAKPDGLTIGVGVPGSTLILPWLAQDPAVKFDLAKILWVNVMNPTGYALGVAPNSPYVLSADKLLKAASFKFACTARNDMTALGAGLISEFFGIQDARIVVGYGSAAEALLSVTKGETDGHITGYTTLRDNVQKGLTKAGLALDSDRSLYFPDTPTVAELMKLSAEQTNLFKTYVAFKAGQAFWLPPGVSQDRVDFVRNVFDKIVASQGFVERAKAAWTIVPPAISGKDYSTQMNDILAVATPARLAELQKLADKRIR